MNRYINIGFGNIVAAEKIVAVVNPEAAPIKRMIQEYRNNGRVIDATCGRKTRAAIVTECGYVILAANQPETIGARLSGGTDAREVCEDV